MADEAEKTATPIPPVMVQFQEWVSANQSNLITLCMPFLPVLPVLMQHRAEGRALTADDFKRAAVVANGCVQPHEIISPEMALGSWVARLPFEVPSLPKQIWQVIEMLFGVLRMSADDLRIIYLHPGSGRHLDRAVEAFKQLPNSAIPEFIAGKEGVEAFIAVADIVVGVAEFVGKHPPDHVIDTIAAARGLKLATLNEKKMFTMKCMLARDPVLKGTPWEQPTIRAKDWVIGVNEVVLICSIFDQIDEHGFTFTVDRGAVTDVEIISDEPADPVEEPSQDGPWSEPDTPSRWAKRFKMSWDTLKRRFSDGTIRFKKLSNKSYQIHVADLPQQ